MGEISGKLPSLVLQAKKQAAPKVYQWFLCRFISEWELFSSVDFHSTKEGSGNGRVGGRKTRSSSRVCPVINWAKKEKVNLFKPPKFCCNHHDWWSFLVCQFTIGSVCGTGIFFIEMGNLDRNGKSRQREKYGRKLFLPIISIERLRLKWNCDKIKITLLLNYLRYLNKQRKLKKSYHWFKKKCFTPKILW